MRTLLASFAKDESGVTAVEYGLIVSLVGVAIIIGAGALGSSLNSVFQTVSDTVSAATPAAAP